jgi:hypothetical protein
MGVDKEIAGFDFNAQFDSLFARFQPQAAGAGTGGNSVNMSLSLNFYGATDAAGAERGARSGVLDALRQVGLA